MRPIIAVLLTLVLAGAGLGRTAAAQAIATEVAVEILSAVQLVPGTAVSARGRAMGMELLGSGSVTAVEGGARLRIVWHTAEKPARRSLRGPLVTQVRTAQGTLPAGSSLVARGDVPAALDPRIDPLPASSGLSPTPRAWLGCPEFVSYDRGVAVMQTRIAMTATGGRPNYGDCAPDIMAGSVAMEDDLQGCDWSVDVNARSATRMQRRIYRLQERVVEVDGCYPRAGAASVPMAETTLFCPSNHDIAAGVSTVPRRLAFQPEAGDAAWRSVTPCLDQLAEQVPITRTSCGQRDGFEWVRWEVTDPGTRRTRVIIDCQPAPEVNTGLIDRPCAERLLFHDDAGWVSFGGRKIGVAESLGGIDQAGGAVRIGTVIADCVADPKAQFPHAAQDVGWRHLDGQLLSIPMFQRYVDGPYGRIDRGSPIPGDPRWPYRLRERKTVKAPQPERLGCVEFWPSDDVELYERPDGSAFVRRQGRREPEVVDRCGR